MANEPLGIVAEGIRRREQYARFIARPGAVKVDAAPAPTAPNTPRTPRTMTDLQIEIGRLRALIVTKDRKIEQLSAQLNPIKPRVSIKEIQNAFCAFMAAAGVTLDGRLYDLETLISKRRTQPHAAPRHVCIALARRLSGASTSVLALAFGKIDHTSVLHATERAPAHIQRDPLLAEAYAHIVALFSAASGRLHGQQ